MFGQTERDTKIFSDADEEITFIVEKILNAPTRRVTVVIPEGATVLRSAVSLSLIKKNAEKVNKRVVVVTMDELGMELCKMVGITCVKRIGDLSEKVWEEDEEKEVAGKLQRFVKVEEKRTPPLLNRVGEVKSLSNEKSSKETERELAKDERDEIEFFVNKEISPEPGKVERVEMPVKKKFLTRVFSSLQNLITKVSVKGRVDKGSELPREGFFPSAIPSPYEEEKKARGFDVYQKEEKVEREGDKESLKEYVVPMVAKKRSVDLLDVESRKGSFLMSLIHRKRTAARWVSKPVGFAKNEASPRLGLKKGKPFYKRFFFYLSLGVFLLFTLGGFLYIYYIAPKARIVLKVQPQKISESIEVKGVKAGDVPESFNVQLGTPPTIPLILIATTDDGADYISTTGSGEFGEKAKGEVSIINVLPDPVTIDAGTELTCITSGCNGLKYKTLGALTVPPAGSDKVQVEALAIGSQYNAPISQKFKVGTIPETDVFGTNTAPFTGGSSETKQIVTRADYDELKDRLQKTLFSSCQSKMRDQVAQGTIVIDKSIKAQVTKGPEADHKVGDPADILNMSMSVSCSALVYRRSDIQTVAKNIVQMKVMSGYSLDNGNLKEPSESIKSVSENEALFEVFIDATADPLVDINDLKTKLKGKSIGEAQNILTELGNIQGYNIYYSPNWVPAFLKHIPNSTHNILIQLEKID